MSKPLDCILNWVAKNFKKDASKMLIWTGVAGWTLSSLAQICAILFNPNIPNEQKSYLVPQEMADAAVNIGSFFLVTQLTKNTVSKLFQTGKFAPDSVRKFLNKHKDLYADKIGKLDFKLDSLRKIHTDFPLEDYYTAKNFGTTVATIGAGVLSSNIITPIVRNKMATKMQKNYIDAKNNQTLEKPNQTYQTQQTTFKANPYYHNSYNLKI